MNHGARPSSKMLWKISELCLGEMGVTSPLDTSVSCPARVPYSGRGNLMIHLTFQPDSLGVVKKRERMFLWGKKTIGGRIRKGYGGMWIPSCCKGREGKGREKTGLSLYRAGSYVQPRP